MIDYQLTDLLAHQGHMVLLKRLVDFDDSSMCAEVVVANDGLFGDATSVPAWVGIEYMAQTVAAHGGLMCKLSGKPINMGFLLGTRRYESNVSSFPVGQVLSVQVHRLIQDQGLGVFECKISAEGIEVSAKLNVYQPDSKDNKVIKQIDE
jgi:predicted hotdog family 3-hydroxylacyl-ACP dehydratase